MNAVDHIDIAIDGAAHTQEKLVDSFADYFIVIVDSSKIVEELGSTFLLPVEVIPKAIKPVREFSSRKESTLLTQITTFFR